MPDQGTIVRWDEAKGFGFIRGTGVAQDVFLHVSDYRSKDGTAPRPGVRVTFEVIHVGGKGPRAVKVQPVSTLRESRAPARSVPAARATGSSGGRPRSAPGPGASWILPVMAAYALALMWLVWQRQLPWWVLPASFAVNLATFFAYWQDKYAAQERRWRLAENTLHLWSLAGGWGGAWLAQRVLRHKSVKASFRAAYSATVVTHCLLAFGAWWFLRTP